MKRELLVSMILVLSVFLSSVANASAATFTDVPSGSWYAEPVAWAVAQGITTGTSSSTFSPNDTCTNAQVITFIWRACGEPEPDIDNPFADVTADKYYYEPALWAYENNIVTGSSFDPNKPCTRSMAVTYLWKELECPEVTPDSRFSDVRDNADYAKAIAWAVKVGITDGTSDSAFSPEATCTRAHIITFLYRDWDGGSIVDSNFDENVDFELTPTPNMDTSDAISFPEGDFDTGSDEDYLEIIL